MAETILEQQVRRREGQEYLASEDIVGKKVKNPEGYDLGEISSLRVGLPTGRVIYAVLRYGGMFGLGAKHFAVPIEAMVYRPGDDVFVANISKYKLDNESGFQEGEWPREANWSLIESTRPMGPPSQEEARAVTKTEAPPREVVTTERVEVREAAGRTGMPIKAEEVEGRGETVTRPSVPVVEEVRREEPARTEAPTVTETRREETVTTGAMEAERPLTTAGPAPGHISAADLQVYLKGMDYPAGREDLVTHARKNSAPAGVITVLEGFGDRTYRSATEVSQEFGSEARAGRPAATGATVTEVRKEEPARTETRSRAPSLAHLSAADLQVYLKGMDYPAGREGLVEHARKNNAPESVIAALEQFGDRTYRSAAEVSEEFGRVK